MNERVSPMKRWKRYPEYQLLPFDWELTIPAHWHRHRLKEVADARPSNVDKKTVEGERSVRLCNYVDVYKNEKITADMDFMEATASDSQIEQFSIQAGDVIITKDSESWDDIAVPAYVPETIEGLVCGYHLGLIRPDRRRLSGDYLARCFQAEGLADQFRIEANGITRYGLGTQSIRCAVFPVPPLPEQRAIVAFLDRESSRIDALIEKKERLIALLEEKRQAIITHAVTRGLNPDAEMKDSGFEWFGLIPRHWNIIKLKHLATLLNGYAFPSEGYVQEGIPVIRIGDVKSDIDWSEVKRVPEALFDRLRQFQIRRGDILLAMTGATIGKTSTFNYDAPALLNQRVGILRTTDVKQQYLGFVVKSLIFTRFIDLLCFGGAQENIGKPEIGAFPICVPPETEQVEIVNYLSEQMTKLDTLKSKTGFGIQKLQEYRTALISAAVTGQIDVREELTLDD